MGFGALTAGLALNSHGFVSGLTKADTKLYDFERKLKGVPEKIAKLQDRMNMLDGAALAVGGSALAAGMGLFQTGKKALSSAGELEKYENVFLAVYKGNEKMAKDAVKWSVDFANRTPYFTNTVIAAYKQLEVYGINAQSTIKTVGEASAAMDKDILQGVEALADARMGEFERLKEFGIKAMTEGDKVLFRYTQNGKDMVKEADKNSSEMMTKTILGIWNEKYDGAMDRLSVSYNGLLSTLGGLWWTFWSDVGNAGVLDAAKEQIKVLIDYIGSERGKSAAQALGHSLADLIKLGGKVIDLGLNAMNLLEPFAGILPKIAAGVGAVGAGMIVQQKVFPQVINLLSVGSKYAVNFADKIETSQLKLFMQADAIKKNTENSGSFIQALGTARAKSAELAGSSQILTGALKMGTAAAIAFTTAKVLEMIAAYKKWRDTEKEINKNLQSNTELTKTQQILGVLRDAEKEKGALSDTTEELLKRLHKAGVLSDAVFESAMNGYADLSNHWIPLYEKKLDDLTDTWQNEHKEEQDAKKTEEDRKRVLADLLAELEKYNVTLKLTGDLEKDIANARRELSKTKTKALDESMAKQYDLEMISGEEYLEHLYKRLNEIVKIHGAESEEAYEWAQKISAVHNDIVSEAEDKVNKEIDLYRLRAKMGMASEGEYESFLRQQLQSLEENGKKLTPIYEQIYDELATITEEKNKEIAEKNEIAAKSFENTAQQYLAVSRTLGKAIVEGDFAEMQKQITLKMIDLVRQQLITARIAAIAKEIMTLGPAGIPVAFAKIAPLGLLDALLAAAEAKVMSLASGAIVNKSVLARVGDNPRSPEVVSPLHELLPMITGAVQNAMAGLTGAFSGPIVIHVPVILDSRQIALATAEYNGGRRK